MAVYLEKIVVFFRFPSKHMTQVCQVLTLLKNAGVTLMLKKCGFLSNTFHYLSHEIQPKKFSIVSHKTNTIKRLKPSKKNTKLRLALGLSHVLQRFVPNFAIIKAPLNRKLQKEKPEKLSALTAEETAGIMELQNC